MRTFLRPVVLAPLLFNVVGCFKSAEAPKSPTHLQEAPPKNTQLTVAEWSAISKPGPSHQLLDIFAGNWDTRVTFWKDPTSEPDVSQGRSTLEWILGGRFLKEEFQGQAAGERFQGLGIMGYDNGARRFVNVWMDSLNTALATATGKYFAEENRFEFVGEVFDPLIGGTKRTRSTIRVLSQDEYRFEMLDTTPEGKEFKSLEIVYTRRK